MRIRTKKRKKKSEAANKVEETDAKSCIFINEKIEFVKKERNII